MHVIVPTCNLIQIGGIQTMYIVFTKCGKHIGYNISVMRLSACLVINLINNSASLFNCTQVGRASDSVMGPT